MKKNQYLVIFGIHGKSEIENYSLAIEVIQKPGASANDNMVAIYEAAIIKANLCFDRDLRVTDIAMHCLTRIN